MNVKELRKKKGVTQEELAIGTGIPRTRIAKWEQGLGKPKSDDHDKLREFFGELIGEEVHNASTRPQEAQQAPDYRDDMIAYLKEKINLNEARVLQLLQRNHALLNAVVETLPKLVSKVEKIKLLEAHEEMNKRIEHHLDVLKKESI